MALPKIFAEVGLLIDGFERNAGEVSKRLNAIDRDAQRALSGFVRMGDRLTDIGRSMSIGITAPLAASGIAAAKFATDFELGMRKVSSLLGSVTETEFKALSSAVIDVSRRMGVDAVKSTEALYEAISSGVPKENAATFLEVATKAAIAGVTDARVAVDALTSSMNAYGPSNLSAKQAADQMFQAVNLGKFTFEQLAASLSIATPLAAQLGIAFSDVLAPAATLTSQGFSISEAMTAVRSAMVGIISPNKAMNELFERLGVTSGEALIKQRGLQGAFEALRVAAGGSTQAIQEALGRVEGLGAVLGTTGANMQTARGHLESIRNASEGAGAATAAFNEINKSAARQFESLLAQLKATGIELGLTLLPAINRVLTAAQPFVQQVAAAVTWFTQLPGPVQTAALAITAAAAAFGPFLLAVGTMISSGTALIGALSSIGGIITAVVIPAIVAFGGAVANVGYAVATGMTGALVGAEAAIYSLSIALGKVILVAGAAIAAFKIGEVLYENIPAVKAFGDAIADLLTYIPGVTTLIEKLSGASSAAARATGDLDFATKKLEDSLKAKGIVVERAGKSAEEYAKALQQAAKGTTGLGDASKDERTKIEAIKKQLKESADAARLTEKATSELGLSVKKTGNEYKNSTKPIENHSLATLLLAARARTLQGEHAKSVTELDRLRLAIERNEVGTVQWDTELQALTGTMQRVGGQVEDIASIKLPAWAAEIPKITRPNQELIDSLGKLGIKSQSEYQKVAEEAAKARDAVLGSGVATDFEKKSAIYKALQAQVEYAKIAGIEVPAEQRKMLEQLGRDLDQKVPALQKPWDTFSRGVSTAISNFSQDMVKSLFEGEGSFADRGLKALSKLGQAVLTSFVEPATAALTEFLNGVIKDLLSGKGLGGVLEGIKGLGSSLGGIFGGGASAAGSAAGAAGSAAGAAGSAAGAAGSAGSGAAGAASGLLGTLGAVGAIGSFASGVISNFQMSSLNKTMGRVEESTRYTAIALIGPGGVIDTERTFLPWLEIIGRYLYTVQQPWFVDVSVYLERLIDTTGKLYDSLAVETNSLLSDMRGQLQFMNDLALEGAGAGGPSIEVNITGNTFATSGQMDQLADIVVDRIQRRIGYR